MPEFNHFERAIAKNLARAPILKSIIKLAYSHVVFICNKKKYLVKSVSELRPCSLLGVESFFGYYDKCPENPKGLILSHLTTKQTSTSPSLGRDVEIALFSKCFSEKLWSAAICAYNWQQGSRLHWLTDELFIYNDFNSNNNSYVSKVVSSISFNLVKVFDLPVQESFKADYFLSLNYRRLMALRPDYGYRNLPPMTKAELERLDTDGIWKVHYKTGASELLISLQQICSIEPSALFPEAMHKVNHVMISPDGSQFIFLHRYLIGRRRFDRLMLANSQTGELRLLSDYGMVSHCHWADGNTILGYMRGPGDKDAFWIIDAVSGSFTHFPALDGLGDGHPNVHGDWFVVDTYPDKARMQHLNLVNWKTGEVKKLGEFFHGFKYHGETRCDLHPRFSACGKKVYFDSVFSGKRKLYAMELDS